MIHTPPGLASSTEKKIKFFLLGLPNKKTKLNRSINADDDTITWEVQAPLKRLMKIQRNVQLYDKFTRGLLENKVAKKFIRKHLTEADVDKLDHMLLKLTRVTFSMTANGNNTRGND